MLKKIKNFLEKTQLSLFVIFALTLGLAPFGPPHIVEKLGMLFEGALVKPIDIFDLFYHALPWGLLIYKLKLQFLTKIEK